MRASTVCIALVVCLTFATVAQAQAEKPPVPPGREFPLGGQPKEPIEQGPAVKAEDPTDTAKDAVKDSTKAADDTATDVEVEVEKATDTGKEAVGNAVDAAKDAAATNDASPPGGVAEVPVTAVDATPPTEAAPPTTNMDTAMPTETVTGVSTTAPAATEVETPVAEATPTATSVPTSIDVPRAAPDPTKAVEMQVAPAASVDSTLTEVELVEKIAVARESYRLSLEALKSHYVDTQNAVKLQRVERELADLNAVDKYHYLEEVDLAPTDLKPSKSISAADQLYSEGVEFKDYPAFPAEKRGKLKVALQKFRTIISDYSESDKIDDAAFRMGEIYAGWYYNDYAQAVTCFERCTQWNPKTTFPAHFRAAKLYDEKLMLRDKAVLHYRMVITTSTDTGHIDEAQRRLKALAAVSNK